MNKQNNIEKFITIDNYIFLNNHNLIQFSQDHFFNDYFSIYKDGNKWILQDKTNNNISENTNLLKVMAVFIRESERLENIK